MEKTAIFRCLKQDFSGKGIVNYKNKTYRIPNFLKDEEAEFLVNKSNDKEPLKFKKLIKKSKNRCAIACPNFGSCPVCTYMHMSYDDEANLKELRVKDIFAKLRDFKYLGITKANKTLGYKNKAQLFATLSKAKKFTTGYYDESNHDIFNVTECSILHERFNSTVIAVNRALSRITPYDSKTRKGIIKSISLRFAANETMVVITTNGIDLPNREGIVKGLRESNCNITNIIQNYVQKEGSKFVEKTRVLFGQGFIFDEFEKIKFRISARSFYDSNTSGMFKLYNEAIKLADIKNSDVIIDTYSQIGILPILLSSKASKVYAVDSNKSNYLDCEYNTKISKCKNVETICNDSLKALNEFSAKRVKADALFVEPSNEGISLEFKKALNKLGPKKLVYISSNPLSLEKDCFELSSNGYSLKKLKIVDIYPRTMETVCVAVLESRNNKNLDKKVLDNKKNNTRKYNQNKLRYIPSPDKDMMKLDNFDKSRFR